MIWDSIRMVGCAHPTVTPGWRGMGEEPKALIQLTTGCLSYYNRVINIMTD